VFELHQSLTHTAKCPQAHRNRRPSACSNATSASKTNTVDDTILVTQKAQNHKRY